ncbi:hypothetical protein QTG54_005244 [Skeletonema marinoi]|uniref:Uncharacterized protein n=1 Tax=Skeletonema marinoi TaxID=267567 RepID=A0AAD8YDV8_9STRA|nr:hypothetical protein QTG54_005244 [Skeletonema marinoi]
MLATKLSSALVAPSKVANTLDWRKAFGAVMGIDVTRDRIGLAIVEHPEHICESVPLKSIPLHDTADMKKAGWVRTVEGTTCTRSVINRSNSIISRKRPFTLWGSSANGSFASFPTDSWGRSVEFARAPAYTPGMSFSSKSVSRQEPSYDPSLVAASVLDEWVEKHWQIDSKLGIATAPKLTSKNLFFDPSSVHEYNSESASLQAALL